MAPEAGYRLVRLMAQVQLKRTISDIKPRDFYKRLPFYTLHFNDVDHNTGEWKDVFLYSRKRGDSDTVILAKKGKFFQKLDEKDSYIVLRDAVVHSYKRKEPEKSYEVTYYKSLKEKVPNPVNIKQRRKERWLIFPELLRRKKKEPDNLALSIEFHRKFALPFACLALGFLALSLGITTKKGGKVSGFIISLAIIFIYYTTSITTENMVRKEIVSPFVGMWAADIFLLVTGIILYYFSAKEKTINWERLFSVFIKIKNKFQKKKTHIKKNVLVVVKLPRILRRFRLIKIIDMYVIKKLMFTFFLIFSSLILVFYIINIVELVDDVVENKVAFSYVFKYLMYHTPEIISFVLPVAILTTVLLTFSVMSKNNEIIAVQVSGISLYRLTLPAILLGLLLSIGYFYVQEELGPESNKKKQETLNIIHKRKSNTEKEVVQNWVIDKKNAVYFYEYLDKKDGKILKFNVLYLNEDFTMQKRLHARIARWIGPQELVLENGFERKIEGNAPSTFKTFRRRQIIIQEGAELFTKRIAFPEHMNIKTLKSYIIYLKEKNADTHKFEAKLYYKYAFPLSSLIMVLIAIPFSFLMGKKGTVFGIGVAIGISMIYWFVSAVFSALGAAAILSPVASAFAPLVLFTAISIYLFTNIKT
jgi:LPS export ABC transporter permease LptG